MKMYLQVREKFHSSGQKKRSSIEMLNERV